MNNSTERKFSLKDHLFNEDSLKQFSQFFLDKGVSFPKDTFIKNCLLMFPDLELKECISYMTDQLENILPTDFEESCNIIEKVLPEKLDPNKKDDDFGHFIIAPFSEYIERYGCNSGNLKKSFSILKEITMRFSVEFSIRRFLNEFPTESYSFLIKCTRDKNYHVRRLASEGSRPLLPWAKRISLDSKLSIQILDYLYCDKTRYVTRSVANHMNDLSKIDPDLVIKTLLMWKKSGKQEVNEMDFIVRHSLRTLIKDGNKDALVMLGYDEALFNISNLSYSDNVVIGEKLTFNFYFESLKEQKIMLSYKISFLNKRGQHVAKLFQITKKEMKEGEKISLSKSHTLKNLSTKKVYPGLHYLSLVVNGVDIDTRYSFILGE